MQRPTAPVSSFAGCDGTRQTPIWIKRRAILPVPFALAAMPPRKNFGAVMRPWGSHNCVGCRVVGANPQLARIPGDPLLLHIGGRRHGIPFNLGGCSPVNNQGLPVAVETLMRSSVSYRMVCAPSAYGNMRGRACAPRPCAPGWYWSCLSFAHRNVWPRRNSAAQNWPPR
jgi:hypothetical protein